MNKKSYWIWYQHDYEIYHITNVNFRREERHYNRPPFWHVSMPYVNVKFRKNVTSNGGYVKCYMNGVGYIAVDNIRYGANERIALSPGAHTILVFVSKPDGLPAIYVESDVCPSDGSWECNYYANEYLPVGYHKFYDKPEQNPEDFPFLYENRLPISHRKIQNGFLYDFGTELFGYLNISGSEVATEIIVSYGESEEEAIDVDKSCLSEVCSGAEQYRLKQRAFRYVFLANIEKALMVTADYEFLPLEKKSDFKSNDELINEIYDVATYTFHLNCREGFLDGIKRDRWVWAADAYLCAKINRYLFADKEIEQRTAIGLIGKGTIEQHINTIVDYSLLWMIGLCEHYFAYGDKVFLQNIYPRALNMLEFCEARFNKDGFIEGKVGDWTFIDWCDMDKTGAVCAEQMLMIAAYDSIYKISEAVGNACNIYAEKSHKLKELVNQYFWKEELGAFIDSYASGRNHVTRHANIFAVMYDVATKEQAESIRDQVLKNDNITPITTPYFKGYELDVLGKMGEFSTIENVLHSYWGGMLQLGAKTFWEEYNPNKKGIEQYNMYEDKYDKSLCHAWGAGPVYLLGRYYLGVYPITAGYETFCVEPQLGGLQEICGTVPVNDGIVTVELNSRKLRVITTKFGGMLRWSGKTYTLTPNEELIIWY